MDSTPKFRFQMHREDLLRDGDFLTSREGAQGLKADNKSLSAKQKMRRCRWFKGAKEQQGHQTRLAQRARIPGQDKGCCRDAAASAGRGMLQGCSCDAGDGSAALPPSPGAWSKLQRHDTDVTCALCEPTATPAARLCRRLGAVTFGVSPMKTR